SLSQNTPHHSFKPANGPLVSPTSCSGHQHKNSRLVSNRPADPSSFRPSTIPTTAASPTGFKPANGPLVIQTSKWLRLNLRLSCFKPANGPLIIPTLI